MKRLIYHYSVLITLAIVLSPDILVYWAWTITQDNPPQIIPLPEVENPVQICVKNERVYIVDKRDIIVYALKDGRLLSRIGKPGQGPGERAIVRIWLELVTEAKFILRTNLAQR